MQIVEILIILTICIVFIVVSKEYFKKDRRLKV